MSETEDKARSIFFAALERPPERWPALLDEACGDNAELRARVDQLLSAHLAMGSIQRGGADATAATVDQPTVAERPGTVIGPYKLLEQIGEGGFGFVFLAEQTQPVRRKVALKVLKPGMDTRQIVARFEAERQALAILDYPNIAKVLDGGVTPSGRPYFVMEVVKGVPITDYCDQNHLTPRQRLELFIPICHAVQHAHQKGIIHRDIKPSNVLVGLHDGKPVPKMIDFGVAKAVGQQLTEATLCTGFGAVIGTPEYMSPEQAQLDNLDIDTRSDIYSLGVLLYELLTGTTPLQHKRVKEAAVLEVLRLVREEEPPKPSTRLSTTVELPSIAANRNLEPRKLTGLVHGELDWIVMKALEKDRHRRYETAGAFAADVQRYLADEPVLACPPSAGYRLRKFARNNRAALTSAAAVLGTIIVGLATSTVLIAQERADAVRERQRAETNLRRAREAVDRVFTLAAEKMADEPHMEQIRRALLEDALEFYQGFLKQKGTDPLIRHQTARAYLRVASIQNLLGRPAQAEDPSRQAFALLQRLVADYPLVPEYRSDLADAYYGFPDHLENVLAALVIKRKLAADFPNRPEFRKALATHLTSVAIQYSHAVQDPRKSEEFYRESLELFQELQKEFPDDPVVARENAWTHWWLGVLYLSTDRFREAEPELRLGLALREKLLESRPNSLGLLSPLAHNKEYLAELLVRTGRPAEAEPLLREAIAVHERMISNYPNYWEYRRRLVIEQDWLKNCLLALGRPQEAEEMSRKCLANSQKLAADFPDAPDSTARLARAYDSLGRVLQDTDRPQEAAEAFREAKRFFEEAVVKIPEVGPRPQPDVVRGRLPRDSVPRSHPSRQARQRGPAIRPPVRSLLVRVGRGSVPRRPIEGCHRLTPEVHGTLGRRREPPLVPPGHDSRATGEYDGSPQMV
jgi:serine/threonine protein kinase